MMFEMHTAFALELLAVLAGLFLATYCRKNAEAGWLGVVSYVVVGLATFGLLCSSYYAVRYWEDGYYKTPFGRSEDEQAMMMARLATKGGMGGMMMCDMMKDMMGGMGGKQGGMKDRPGQGSGPGPEGTGPGMPGGMRPGGDPDDHDAHHPEGGD